MALNSSDTNVPALVINKCTKAQYDAMPSHSLSELYLVPEADDALRTVTASGSGYVTLTAGAPPEDDETLEQYTIVENIPETACFTDELYIRKLIEFQKYPRCVKWELYKKECNDGTIFGMSARRINYKFQDVNMVSAFVTIPIASIPIPIVSNNWYDTYQETNINEKFVKYEVERSKNKIVELEKYVYHPVYRVVNDDIVSYIPLMKIKFNFHFRQRLEDGWIVDTNGLWNGMGENSMPILNT